MLTKSHLEHLRSEGFSASDIEQMEAWGVRSIEPQEASELGFRVKDQPPTGGLYFPFTQGFGQIRCDSPPIRNGKRAKYLTPVGAAAKAWNSQAPVVTEGFKDAARGTLIGRIQTGALAGVSHYAKALEKGSGQTILFDHDAWTNPSVFLNLFKAGKFLKGKIQVIPAIDGEPKAGLCEYFKAGHTAEDYARLIASAMSPEDFLFELPKHWNNLTERQLIDCVKVLANQAVRNLNQSRIGALINIVKTAAKGKLYAGDIKREFDRATVRLLKEKAKARRRDKPEGCISIEFDKRGNPVVPAASFVANFLVKKWIDLLRWDCVSEKFWRYQDGVWRQAHDAEVRSMITFELNQSEIKDQYSANLVNSIGSLLADSDHLQLRKWPRESKYLLPMANGVLNRRTMRLEPHSPDHYFRYQLPYDYDPTATCKPIVDWLMEAQKGDRHRVQVLLAYLKAILDSRTDLQRFLECTGPGGSGKGTYTRMAQALIGLENCHCTTLKQLEENRFETASIYGKRLVIIADADRYGGSVDTLKSLTGQDLLRYERKGLQQGGGFIAEAMLLVSDNEHFQSSDNTSGLSRRRLSIPFELQVDSDKRRDLISLNHAEERVSGELAPYLPGLLNLLLSIPDSEVTRLIRDTDKNVPSLAEARIRSLLETNPIAAWVDSNIVLREGCRTNVGRIVSFRVTEGEPGSSKSWEEFEHAEEWLYPNYVRFCKQSGQQPISMKRFSGIVNDLLSVQLKLNIQNPPRDRDGAHFIGIAIRGVYDDEPRPISDLLMPSEKPAPSEMIEPSEPVTETQTICKAELPSAEVNSDPPIGGGDSTISSDPPIGRDSTISSYADRARKLNKDQVEDAAAIVREMQSLPLEWRRTFWGTIKNLPCGSAIRKAIDKYPELQRTELQRTRSYTPAVAVDPKPCELTMNLLSPDLEYLADPEAEPA